jgi:hypothetical protein
MINSSSSMWVASCFFNTIMNYNNDGKVGIGTNTFSKTDIKLEVDKGNVLFHGKFIIGEANKQFSFIPSSNLGPKYSSNNFLAIFPSANTTFELNPDQNQPNPKPPPLIIDATGKVSIGGVFNLLANNNMPPKYMLYVNQGILTEKVKVAKDDLKNDEWSDYVFNNDYKLTTLNDLDQFIKINKHLPEIPTFEEVKENGVDLLEMDSKLLKKIEDLTLYIIEQNKIMQQQNDMIQQQNKRIEILEKKL